MTQAKLAPLSARTPPLTRKRKAAMIVQLLIGDGGKLELSQLPEEMQMLLARELGAIRLIDRDTVHQVFTEFTRDLVAVGLSSPGGADGAIDALSDHMSPNLANRLRAELANAKGSDPWAVMLALPDEGIVKLMNSQSVEVGAITLSKMSVARAAAVLENCPGRWRAKSPMPFPKLKRWHLIRCYVSGPRSFTITAVLIPSRLKRRPMPASGRSSIPAPQKRATTC